MFSWALWCIPQQVRQFCTRPQRHLFGRKGPSLKRNVIPFVDFDTQFPKRPINPDALSSANPYTMVRPFVCPLRFVRVAERFGTRFKICEKDPKGPLCQGRCIRQLSVRKIQVSGRNITGRITSRRRGGGRARRLRFIDFKRGRKDIWATVLRIEYDPNRTARIALIQYEDGVLSYILSTHTVAPGQRIIASTTAPLLPGNALPLRNIPVSSVVHSVENVPGGGGKMVRSSGTLGKVIAADNDHATLELPSGELKKFPLDCWATIGRVSLGTRKVEFNKAGRNRWMGIRPRVRGTSMHKHKHPHGGESGGLPTKNKPAKTKWGKPALNYKTRSPYKPLGLILERRFKRSLKNKSAFVEGTKKTSKQY